MSPNQLFLPNDIHQSPTHSREQKDPRVKQFQIRAGMCSSKSLLIFTSVSVLSCATTQQGLGGRAWSRRGSAGLNLSSSSKAQLHPHMFTQDSVPLTCRQIFKALTLRHKKPFEKAALSLLCRGFLKSYNVSWWITWRLSCAALWNLSWLMEILASVVCSQLWLFLRSRQQNIL